MLRLNASVPFHILKKIGDLDMLEKVLTTITNVLVIVNILFLIWILVSWYNVTQCNMSIDLVDNLWDLNFFKVFFN